MTEISPPDGDKKGIEDSNNKEIKKEEKKNKKKDKRKGIISSVKNFLSRKKAKGVNGFGADGGLLSQNGSLSFNDNGYAESIREKTELSDEGTTSSLFEEETHQHIYSSDEKFSETGREDSGRSTSVSDSLLSHGRKDIGPGPNDHADHNEPEAISGANRMLKSREHLGLDGNLWFEQSDDEGQETPRPSLDSPASSSVHTVISRDDRASSQEARKNSLEKADNTRMNASDSSDDGSSDVDGNVPGKTREIGAGIASQSRDDARIPVPPQMQADAQSLTTVQQGVSADTGQQAGAAEENAPQAVAQAEAQAIAPQAARDNAQPADQAAADQAAADQAAADVETVAAAYQPGVPVYAAYGQIVRLATSLPTMQERIGKRYWAGQGAAQIEEGDGEEARLSWKGNDILTDLGLVWGQAEAGHRHAALAGSDLHTRYTANDWKVTLGLDNQLHEANDNRLLGGVWVRYSRINADIASALGKGAIETQAYGVGGALTWLSDNGLYVDAQAQYSRLKSELSPDKVSKALASNAKAESYDVSLEAGKSVRLNDYWTLTPQVQLSWNHVTANSFTDADANTVRFELKDQVTLRGGVAVEYAKSWQDKGGKTVRASVHGIANLRHRLAGKGSRLQLADQSVKIGHEERTWGEIGLGGRYELKDRRLAVFGDVTAGTAMNNPGKNHYVAGKLGLSIKW